MKTYDINIHEFVPLISPAALQRDIPISDKAARTVIKGRESVQSIIGHQDKRLVIITGPCSIHDEAAALEYAQRLLKLQSNVSSTLLLIMRVYFEKPRTTVGWKGLINDPYLDGSCDMMEGLKRARKLLLQITEMGVPTATEMLDPITPQYLAGLVCWTAIGARTTESQTHREMASGLSMPVGFKNGTEGDLGIAINAMIAARSPQNFLGMDPNGQTAIVRTKGNAYAHLVLRGGRRPNYDSVSLRDAIGLLRDKGLDPSIIVDCSHGNSRKRFKEQLLVWDDVINQRCSGNDAIIGLMLESNLNEGCQENSGDLLNMKYGVSITDACISWEATENLVCSAHDRLERCGTRN